jgi:regulator of RNase E activity RraA
MRSGIWGELLSTAAKNRGCVGAIVDGAVRDITKMKAMGFTVFAKARCIYDSLNRQRVIAVDEPVKIDDVIFRSGDLVLADQDGIVVVPQEIEEQAMHNAWQKVHDENITRDAIIDGMLATDAYRKYGVL